MSHHHELSATEAHRRQEGTVTRRQLLTAAAVAPLAPIVATLPGTAVNPVPIEPERVEPERLIWFQLTGVDSAGDLACLGSNVFPTRPEAERAIAAIPKHAEKVEITEIEVAFPGNRYRVVFAWIGVLAAPVPSHVLALPPVPVDRTRGGFEPVWTATEIEGGEAHYDTRAAALAAVAAHNTAVAQRGPAYEDHWSTAVEIGDPIKPLELACPGVHTNGLGFETISETRPARIVRPTAAEIAQYASTPGSKSRART